MRSVTREPRRSSWRVRSNKGTLRRLAATLISRAANVSPIRWDCKTSVSFANHLSRQNPFSPDAMLVHAVGDHFCNPQRLTPVPPVHPRPAAGNDTGEKFRDLTGETILSRDLDRIEPDGREALRRGIAAHRIAIHAMVGEVANDVAVGLEDANAPLALVADPACSDGRHAGGSEH